MAATACNKLAVLGWREWVGLPDLGIPRIRCKVDTGARSSSLHVEWFELDEESAATRVRFALQPERDAPLQIAAASVIDQREVTDSGGRRALRPFIRTALAIAGVRYEIELNLTSRRDMMFPMLLGRTALAGRWQVDPAASFLHSPEAAQEHR